MGEGVGSGEGRGQGTGRDTGGGVKGAQGQENRGSVLEGYGEYVRWL